MAEAPAGPRAASGGALVAAAAAAPPPAPFNLLNVCSTPIPLKLTWARDGVYPAALCLRKEYRVAKLLKFTAKADLTLPHLQIVCGFSCKDTVFHGRFSANLAARMVEYRKKFTLPNGTALAVSAGLQHTGEPLYGRLLRDQFKPLLSAQLLLGDLGGRGSGNIVYTGGGFDVKQRLPLPWRVIGFQYPRLELEAYSTLKIPQLTTRYSVQRDGLALQRGAPAGVGDSRQDDALHLHVSSTNLVIRL